MNIPTYVYFFYIEFAEKESHAGREEGLK